MNPDLPCSDPGLPSTAAPATHTGPISATERGPPPGNATSQVRQGWRRAATRFQFHAELCSRLCMIGRSMAKAGTAAEVALSQQLVDFIEASPSPFHTVDTVSKMLTASGFTRISERDDAAWDQLAPNGKYFFTRNQSTVFAVCVGGKYKPGNGLTIAAAHTDSPVLRVKPISNIVTGGVVQVGVETYGGGLWNTWFDRDLSLAGRVVVAENGQFRSKLLKIDRPILSIPNLAIHLNRDISSDGFKPNFETHLLPILATEVKAALSAESPVGGEKKDPSSHHPVLLDILAESLKCNASDIRDFELSLFDTNRPCIGGALKEFIYAPRLDNLGMSFCCIRGLIDATGSLANDPNMRVVALFDHEEIGSASAQGAASNMMPTIIDRLTKGVKTQSTIRKSFLVSADMAHACHPNYSEKHEARHRPKIHNGVVIKFNAKQRYATNSETAFILKEIARRRSIPVQEFVVRNDSGCGSTVGPILASNTGVRTIDIGIPQLAMHSIREMCGVGDVTHGVNLMDAFFTEFPNVDAAIVPAD
ncbi:aspartyl aminopeptidase [Plasmodiophora brassicae]|uniref:aspartyl aminopeptidase n=1 Tax=Plasmodiophora brassicae TaxID=37360 RepID=A0A3P3XZL6_PLABS|nr:unnamed protein product [Plasmodiophora brassicae]